MLFYTPEEFQKFLSVEDDPKFVCAFSSIILLWIKKW